MLSTFPGDIPGENTAEAASYEVIGCLRGSHTYITPEDPVHNPGICGALGTKVCVLAFGHPKVTMTSWLTIVVSYSFVNRVISEKNLKEVNEHSVKLSIWHFSHEDCQGFFTDNPTKHCGHEMNQVLGIASKLQLGLSLSSHSSLRRNSY